MAQGLIPFQNTKHRVDDPLHELWPATLPLELAMRDQSPEEICRAYGITRERFIELGENMAFRAELKTAVEALRKEGASFRVRAQMQAVELLKRSWEMIHDTGGNIPPAVQADLLKFTIKAAGYDASRDGIGGKNGVAAAFNIVLNLGG